jgi:hypothetical protein
MRLAKLKLLGIVMASLTPFFSCVEEEPKIIPDVYVNLKIYLEYPQFTDLQVTGNAIIYPNEGYNDNGVIIFRLSPEEFLAFDATCPQHIEENTAIAIDSDEFATGKCPHCNTTYSFLNYGQASSGYPLKRYKTTYSGGYVYITN